MNTEKELAGSPMTLDEINEEKRSVEREITSLVNKFAVKSNLKVKKLKLKELPTMGRSIYSAYMKLDLY